MIMCICLAYLEIYMKRYDFVFYIYIDFLARILKDFNQTLYLFQVTSICSFFNVGFVIQVED